MPGPDHSRTRTALHRAGVALLGAVLLTGCGTRLEDAAIRRAAGLDTQDAGFAGQTSASEGAAGAGTTAEAPGLAAQGAAAVAPTAAANTPVAGAGSSATVGLAASARSAGSAGGSAKTATGAAAPLAATGTRAAGSSPATAGSSSQAAAAPGAGPGVNPGSGAAVPAARTPVVLGHVGDYSGVIGTVLKGGNVMAQVVARYMNDHGGLDGHPVQLVTADAGGDPARALSLVRDMVETKGAVAFVGNAWVFSGYGPREYLETHKIPVIGGDSTTRVWFQSPVYFPSSASFPAISFGALKQLVDIGKKKVGILYCVEAEQCKVWRDTAVAKAASVGAQIVYDAQVSLAQPDFTAECVTAQRNGAEGIMVGMDSPSVLRFARACAQQGYKPQLVNATLAVIEAAAKEEVTQGMLAVVGTFPHMVEDTAEARAYHAAIKQYSPSLDSSPTTTTVWTAGALLRAVGQKMPDKVTSADFFAGLYGIKNNTLGGLVGPLTFNEGRAASPINCVFGLKVVDHKYTAPAGSQQQCF
jgi:branched-chain amino acid transport system substrate-binding protein